ncbi:MAG: DUF1822 family protein [Synechococcales bacterium]|nr:DUF1822 family protein [Synechococcales bacterium]
MTTTLPQPIPILLEPDAHRYAAQFAAEQASVSKGKQVYLNTLAVCAVQRYLQFIAVRATLHDSDCWHPGVRAVLDVADLTLPQQGRLECRPVLANQPAFTLPPEVVGDRLGYVAVAFDQDLSQAELLGFLPSYTITDPLAPIDIHQLRPMDALIDTLHAPSPLVQLRQWLERQFPPGWQPVEQVIPAAVRGRATGGFAVGEAQDITYQDAVSRGKTIPLGDTGGAIALVMRLLPGPADFYHIRLRLYPSGELTLLPPALQVTLMDSEGEVCAAATPRQADDWLQLDFDVAIAEPFCICLTLGDVEIIERFVV